MTAPQRNVVDMVTDRVMGQLRAEIGAHVQAAAEQVIADVQQTAEHQIGEFLSGLVPEPAPTADAADRAQRTAIQGVISTVVVAVLLAVAGVIGGGAFDWSSGASWTAVGGAALGAVVTAVTAYIHRLVSPPKG